MRLEHAELAAFQAVVEAHGFNRAAERLNISQSAVSQAIANLEAKLDVPLLLRGKRLELTEAGRRLLDHADGVLREERQVLEDIAGIKRGDAQVLNLAINSTINRYYAPSLLERFSQAGRDIRVKVSELPSRDLIYAVLSGRAELALGPFQHNMDAFETVPLYRDNRHLVVSPNHPDYPAMAAGDTRSLKTGVLITSFLDKSDPRPGMQRIRDHFRFVWEVSSLNLRIHLVDRGLGMAFIDDKSLDSHPVCRDFTVIRDLSFSPIERQVGLYYRAGRMLHAGNLRFIELCKEFWNA